MKYLYSRINICYFVDNIQRSMNKYSKGIPLHLLLCSPLFVSFYFSCLVLFCHDCWLGDGIWLCGSSWPPIHGLKQSSASPLLSVGLQMSKVHIHCIFLFITQFSLIQFLCLYVLVRNTFMVKQVGWWVPIFQATLSLK